MNKIRNILILSVLVVSTLVANDTKEGYDAYESHFVPECTIGLMANDFKVKRAVSSCVCLWQGIETKYTIAALLIIDTGENEKLTESFNEYMVNRSYYCALTVGQGQ